LLLCYLPARDLGAITMTCRDFNFGMAQSRISHLFSRLKTTGAVDQVGKLKVALKFCENETEVREILLQALEGSGNTGRLVTKKSKQGVGVNAGDADEYISYVRFLEEALQGKSLQKIPGQLSSELPPIVNGRFASVSPEHSLCRVGGDGNRSGGGSGCASWGTGKRGQLGHGKRKDEHIPKMLHGGIGYGTRIVQVSAGGGLLRVAHTLLLTSTGRVLSCGTAQYGQLGHGYSPGKQLPDVLRPQNIEHLAHFQCVCVSAGELHSAVVTVDGDLHVWGDGFCGQLGLADKRPKLVPEQVTRGGLEDECVLSVSCGARHTLAVTEDGEVYSFGLGHFGVLGRSYTPYEYYSNNALSSLGVDVDIEREQDGLQYGGAVDNEMRQQIDLLANLTLDDNSDQCIPQVIDSLQGIQIIGVSAGHRHSVFLDARGNVYTCGDGSGGALGHGNLENQKLPMKVIFFANKGIKIMQISAGVDTTMVVSTMGEVWAFGNTKNGCIGLQSKNNYVFTPHRVDIKNESGAIVKAVDVEAGYVHSMIVNLDGSVYMCGVLDLDEMDGPGPEDSITTGSKMFPCQVPNFNIWHRLPEPKDEKKKAKKWVKYGKYELKGRSSMMAESS